MGILNIIRLANDYNNAKKLLKKNNVDKIKIKEYMDKLHDYIESLNDTKDIINVQILKVKETMRSLSEKLKARKENK